MGRMLSSHIHRSHRMERLRGVLRIRGSDAQHDQIQEDGRIRTKGHVRADDVIKNLDSTDEFNSLLFLAVRSIHRAMVLHPTGKKRAEEDP